MGLFQGLTQHIPNPTIPTTPNPINRLSLYQLPQQNTKHKTIRKTLITYLNPTYLRCFSPAPKHNPTPNLHHHTTTAPLQNPITSSFLHHLDIRHHSNMLIQIIRCSRYAAQTQLALKKVFQQSTTRHVWTSFNLTFLSWEVVSNVAFLVFCRTFSYSGVY